MLKLNLSNKINIRYVVIVLFVIINAITCLSLLSKIKRIDENLSEAYLPASYSLKELKTNISSLKVQNASLVSQAKSTDKSAVATIDTGLISQLIQKTSLALSKSNETETGKYFANIEIRSNDLLKDQEKFIQLLSQQSLNQDQKKIAEAAILSEEIIDPSIESIEKSLTVLYDTLDSRSISLIAEKETHFLILKCCMIIFAIFHCTTGLITFILNRRKIKKASTSKSVNEQLHKLALTELTFDTAEIEESYKKFRELKENKKAFVNEDKKRFLKPTLYL